MSSVFLKENHLVQVGYHISILLGQYDRNDHTHTKGHKVEYFEKFRDKK